MDERGRFLGRCCLPRVTTAVIASAPGRSHLADPAAEWWAVTSTLLDRWTRLRIKEKDLPQQMQLRGWVEERLKAMKYQATDYWFGTRFTSAEILDWHIMVWACVVQDTDVGTLEQARVHTERMAASAWKRAMISKSKGFEE